MKLIHCSDFHLDSAMESNLSALQARERNAELCMTFSRMVEYAKQEDVSVILLAGDLFDTDRITATTSAFLLDTIANNPNIDFLYIKGNHDEAERAFAGRILPENLKTFADDWSSHHYGSVTVTAAQLNSDNCTTLYDSLQLDPAELNIVMLHGQISARPAEDAVCLPRLRNQHIDYLALGHLHSYHAEKLDDRGIWCYSGCPEGRGFDECGKKGFVLLEAMGGRISHCFIPFARRTLHDLNVDISSLADTPAILRAMRDAAAGIPTSDLVKFTLGGTYTTQTHKDLPFLQTMLSSRFYAVKIKDDSRLQLDAQSYEHDISLKGEFIRTVLASALPQQDKDRIICAGLEALRGEEISL